MQKTNIDSGYGIRVDVRMDLLLAAWKFELELASFKSVSETFCTLYISILIKGLNLSLTYSQNQLWLNSKSIGLKDNFESITLN